MEVKYIHVLNYLEKDRLSNLLIILVNLAGDSWNTLQIELIDLHSKLTELGFIYVDGQVVYPGLKGHDT